MRLSSFFIYVCFCLGTLLFCFACINEPSQRPENNSHGHRYTYHQIGNGPQAKPGEHILYHVYQRADDSLINSSRQRPLQPRLVVPDSVQALELRNPVNEALLRMAVGDSLTISIPISEVPQRPAGFKDYEYLHFDVCVTGIQSAIEFQKQMEKERLEKAARQTATRSRKESVKAKLEKTVATYKNQTLELPLITKASGLQYCVHKTGKGNLPEPGDLIQVHYYGMLPNGQTLTHSFDDGRPYQFFLGEGSVIPGWEEAIAELSSGSLATLFVPPHLAYGEKGQPPNIPAKTNLIYYIEILD